MRFFQISLVICSMLIIRMGACRSLHVCETCPIRDLAIAVQTAQEGDTLWVGAGTYPCENLTIDKKLHLYGKPGAILDGKHHGHVLRLMADSISVEGFQIINSGRSYTKDYAGVYISGAQGVRLVRNEIRNSFFGILMEKSKSGVIRKNRIFGSAKKEADSGNGVHLWHCRGFSISDNEISGMRDGIYLEFVDSSKVTRNYSHHNVRYGLHFMFSNYDEYSDNTFESNGAGVAVMFSKWINMLRNEFINNWGTASYGLLLKEIYDGNVQDNRFVENTQGIFIDGSSRITYQGNTLQNNGWAVKVTGGCYANSFWGNNFVGNSFDISYNSRMNDNSFDGNYWSSYTGYDLDKDGKGDVPYRPVKLFSYIVNQTPETIVLLRSLFVDLINFSEKVSPVFTPDDLLDLSPSMKAFL